MTEEFRNIGKPSSKTSETEGGDLGRMTGGPEIVSKLSYSNNKE